MKVLDKALRQFASISLVQFIFMTLVASSVYTIIIVIKNRKAKREMSLPDVIPWYCYIIYINVILQLTLMGRKDGSRIGVELQPFQFLQKGGAGYSSMLAFAYSGLNLLLFVPYGFIVTWLPLIRKQKIGTQMLLTTLISLATSQLIEILQLGLGRGYYELEDLICNTSGGFVGTVLFIFVYRYIMSSNKFRN